MTKFAPGTVGEFHRFRDHGIVATLYGVFRHDREWDEETLIGVFDTEDAADRERAYQAAQGGRRVSFSMRPVTVYNATTDERWQYARIGVDVEPYEVASEVRDQGWSDAAPWPQEAITPPCAICTRELRHRQQYRTHTRLSYLIPVRALGPHRADEDPDATVSSPQRVHDSCLIRRERARMIERRAREEAMADG